MKRIEKARNFIFCLSLSIGFSAEYDSSFSVKWQNLPWGAGGLIPAGPPRNMVGPYDFDNDGFGDFVVASSYAGEYCNGVYHYEATQNDSVTLQWVYTFYDLSCAYDAYSSVAVGDIDGDNNPEILSLVDTSPGISGQKGLQIFEWNPDSSSFLSSPTYTWDMGLDSVWESGQILAAELDGDGNQEIIVSVMDGPWSALGTGGSSRMMIFELDSVISAIDSTENDSAIFTIEYTDDIWTNWSGYNISTGDLDNDGFMEIYTVAYEFYHLIIHESDGVDAYSYQADFFVSENTYDLGSQSIIVTDINQDGNNEMFVLISGTNSLTNGNPYAPGVFYAVESVDDISTLNFEHFHFFKNYTAGLRQINIGDADGDGNIDLYLAGYFNEAVFDWEFGGGDPLSVENYTERIIFRDDTTDHFDNTSFQGLVSPMKLFSGDIDNDGNGDLIISSGSFASDKPTLFMVEHDGTLSNNEQKKSLPNHFHLEQNYPNPFNPETQFSYTLTKEETIELAVYDVMGRTINILYKGRQRAGNHNVLWSGVDQNNNSVPSGIYFYRLQAGSTTKTKKMALNR